MLHTHPKILHQSNFLLLADVWLRVKSSTHLIVWISLGVLLMRASIPPLSFSICAYFLWVPTLLLALRYSVFTNAIAGIIIGASWVSDLPIALLNWGIELSVGSIALGGALIAVLSALNAFLVQRALHRHVAIHVSLLIFLPLYLALVHIGQHCIPAPFALSPLVIHQTNAINILAPHLGLYGLEALIVGINIFIAITINCSFKFIKTQRLRKCYLLEKAKKSFYIICVSLLFISSIFFISYNKNSDTPESKNKETLHITSLQGAISHRDALRAGNSMYHRKQNVDLMLSLTEEALQSDTPQLIIWPEGGHNFPNISVKHRREKILSLAASHPNHELLIAGYEHLENREKINTISHVNQWGFGSTIVKAITAPLAEENLKKGLPGVISTKFGKAGIAICYESLFYHHFKALKEKGADFFVITTDDSSFENTFLYQRHIHYAQNYAAIFNTPAIFINNRGLSVSIDANGDINQRDNNISQAHITQWDLDLPNKTYDSSVLTNHRITTHFLCLFFALIFFIYSV